MPWFFSLHLPIKQKLNFPGSIIKSRRVDSKCRYILRDHLVLIFISLKQLSALAPVFTSKPLLAYIQWVNIEYVFLLNLFLLRNLFLRNMCTTTKTNTCQKDSITVEFQFQFYIFTEAKIPLFKKRWVSILVLHHMYAFSLVFLSIESFLKFISF